MHILRHTPPPLGRPNAAKPSEEETKEPNMHELNISGMTCSHCEKAVKDALASVPGAEKVDVDLSAGTAKVEGAADLKLLISAVEDEGYRATAAR